MPDTAPPAKDPFITQIEDLAKKYKLEGEEAAEFIKQHLTHAGYKEVVQRTYLPPEPETGKTGDGGNAGGSGWFGGKKSS